jgi:hypothetical protein
MQNRRIMPILFATLLLSSCSQKQEQPSVPTFVNYAARQQAAMDAGSTSAGNSFADIKGRLEAIQDTAYAGTEVQIVDSVVNAGPPASGVRLVVKGNGFDDGIFGAPVRATVSTGAKEGGTADQKDFTLTQDGTGAYTGTVDIKCEKDLNVSVVLPAKKGGQGDVQMFVYPKDKGGASSAAFLHTYTVRSETEGIEN